MNIFYDHDRDYAEIFFRREHNYGEAASDDVTIFRSEQTNEIVGYAFEDASKQVFESTFLTPSIRLAALLKMIRARHENRKRP